MKLEKKIHLLLMNHPIIKKNVKRCYQRINTFISKPHKFDGDVVCVSPQDSYDYFFGYYDKSPWDATNQYMLCMRAKDTSRNASPADKLDILLIDTKNENKPLKIAESKSWNVQQGCMAQWLGPDFKEKIIYNDFRNGKYCSVILNIKTKEERVINFPVYSVASNGEFALSLDFSRLHRLRPGYGYSNIEDATNGQMVPQSSCIWLVDLRKNKVESFLDYNDFYNFENRIDMVGAEHKVNHIMISPNNDKFMVIHRWLKNNKKYSRLITCDIKTKKLFNLSDDDMVSHCYWKNNNEIVGFLNKKKEGNGYFLLEDKTHEYRQIWPDITSDGHPSYSSDSKFLLTDCYPNRKRIQTLRILSENESYVIARVLSPFKYDNDTRCDLHPRWSRDNKIVCFDGCFDNNRRLYTVNTASIIDNEANKKVNYKVKSNSLDNDKKYKVLYFMTSCKKCGPTNQTLNIIKNLDREKFDPYLVTIYDEEPDSQIQKFLPYVTKHFTVRTSKKSILLKKTKQLDQFIREFNADLIHTVGLFPNYYVSGLVGVKQITTLRNYIYDDYPAKFGKIVGFVMAKLQIRAIKNTTKVVTCSKSLSDIYRNKLNFKFDFIQNGVDVNNYIAFKQNEKQKIRKELKLDMYKSIFIYTGQFIERKNIVFLLENFSELYNLKKEYCLILLGDGPLLNKLQEKFSNFENIKFYGSSNMVNKYLNASDYYVSTSLSEGLPNGALEALSCGLPVILSDIPQHKELFMYDNNIGCLFKSNDSMDFKNSMLLLTSLDYDLLHENARKVIDNNFSDLIMSKNYQREYLKILNNDEIKR